MSAGNALIITAKYPKPGTVKTRLARRLGYGLATEIYCAFLRDIDAKLTQAFPAVYWAYTPGDSPFPEFLGPGRNYLIQQGDDIGETMFELLRLLLMQGYEKVVLIGSDLPHLSVEVMAEAFEKLANCDVVLGPSADGGYYLIGMRDIHDLFSDVTWSTDLVLAQTLTKAAGQGLNVDFLPETFDVDEVEDIEKLRSLLAARRAGTAAPRTARALSGWHSEDRGLGNSKIGRYFNLTPAQVEKEEQECLRLVRPMNLAGDKIAEHMATVAEVAGAFVQRIREDLGIPLSEIAVAAARYHDTCRCDDRSHRLRPFGAENKDFFFPHDGHEARLAFGLRKTGAKTIARIIRKHCVLRIAYPEERTIDENILLIADSMVEAEQIVPVSARRQATIGRHAGNSPVARRAYDTAYDIVERTLETYFAAGLDRRRLLMQLGIDSS